jgi:hypothetical protein
MRLTHGMLLAGLLLTGGCLDVYRLAVLRDDLSREFDEKGIQVTLTDGLILTVTFIDGPWLTAACDRQAELALRVARYVNDHYEGLDSLQVLSIAFTHRPSADSMAPTSTHLPFRFSPSALQAGRVAADSAAALALCELETGGSPAGAP